MKKIFILGMFLFIVFFLSACGNKSDDDGINENLDLSENVTLKIIGPWPSWLGIETVIEKFEKKYPNTTVVYEFVQNYSTLLETRLANQEDEVAIFSVAKIEESSDQFDNALELYSQSDLDFSDMHPGLLDNFSISRNANKEIYSIPYGGEIRGMYVNKTLLAHYNLEIPKNRVELLNACQTLLNNGIVPFRSNPGDFGQQLIYPYICNLITSSSNYQATYDMINRADENCEDLFEETLKFLYDLVAAGYYNYKNVTNIEHEYSTDSKDKARLFFNIRNDNDEYVKFDDLGGSPFVTGILSQKSTYEQIKQDYHSAIDYDFILSPVGPSGGSAYMSPTQGIAINKNYSHIDWAVEFFDFLFQRSINEEFAYVDNIVPNTTTAFDYIEKHYNIDKKNMSHLGMVTFDYNFFTLLNNILIPMVKINNPKYMIDDGNDGKTYQTFEFYMNQLSTSFKEIREGAGD